MAEICELVVCFVISIILTMVGVTITFIETTG